MRYVFPILLIVLLLFLQYELWLGQGSLPDAWQLNKSVNAQRSENAGLQQRNLALAAEVLDLRKGHEAIEERARNELGMIRKGETFYQIVKPAPAQPAHHGSGG